jgi:hypothetical protein
MTDYSAAIERLRTSTDPDVKAALEIIYRLRARFIADCEEAGLSPEDAEIELAWIEGNPVG